ncbi:hypothetical protein Cni_G03177 [Canna indica]|uniref:GYF domain-containing protein n=1 Tax=Canna indica TaxID=4628 RepID=A0AAQ3JU39_9LILI|nr:hypothetical protein Cni_G03177 [Canna indica]
MASGNLDLPEDLLLSKPAEEAWAGKDQLTSDNSIPLSPQWLYSKPSDSKDARPANSASFGTLPDSIQKDIWRMDGSLDKKEWRKGVTDSDSSRRWREEERETSLLGRRERKKEGDREIDYRKSDRRPDNAPMREAVDSSRLHEVSNRGSGNESRRDSKWSSRWGPEDKDKEPRTEKKVDAEKEDSHIEKQSFIASLRPLSGVDSRDKWRPRHRQDVHSGGPSVLRAAPGFGLERDRAEVSNAGFARGRGRSNAVSILQVSRSFAPGPIGSQPVNNAEFHYPRGKLLDIYRKQKTTVIEAIPEGFEEAPPITESSFVTPLAFITPNADEEVLLKDIWKGKVTSSEAGLNQAKKARPNEIGKGDGIDTLIEKKHGEKETFFTYEELHSDCVERKSKDPLTHMVGPDSLDSEVIGHNKLVSDGNIKNSEINAGDTEAVNIGFQSSHLDILENIKLEGKDSTIPIDVSLKLPVESYPLLDVAYAEEIPSSNKLEYSKVENRILGSPEELSLYYQDPQGDIQGPFLGVDIISWFEQGFFGIDLPVCLSDAPEGTPFQPLGDIMPHLKLESHSIPGTHPGENSELLDATREGLESCFPSSHVSGPFPSNDQVLAWDLKHNALENEALIDSNRDFSAHDSEVVLYKGRSLGDVEKQSGKLANDHIAISRSLSGQHYMVNETGNTSFSNHNVPRDNDLNPLGLLWSELEGTQQKLPLSSTIPGSAENLIDNYDYTRNASVFNHNQEQVNSVGDFPINSDTWSNKYRRSNSSTVSDNLDASNMSRFESESNQFGLEQHLLFQQLQKQQLKQQIHQQRILAHQNSDLTGTFFDQVHGPLHQHHPNQQPPDDLERMLKFQFEQQLHLDQLQQQRQLQQRQQQQLHEHQMQLLQHHLQRHEPQPQQQMHLENFLHRQLLEPGIGATNIDPHGASMLDQILFRQQLLNESQKQPHNLSHGSAMEQLIQANFGHFQRQNHNDLLDVLTHSKQRQMEQQYILGLQLEQLQARQLSNSSRNLPGMEEERHLGGVWAVDESGQFIRTAASPHQNYSARLSQLDLMQTQQGPSFLEHPSHPQRNFLTQERMQQRGPYERGLHPTDRSMHMHASTSPPNIDFINALARARAQGLDAQDHLDQLHASSHLGQFPSNFRSLQSQISNEFPGAHMDITDSHWSETGRQLPADVMDSRLKQLQIKAEKQRATNMNLSVESPNVWPLSVGNDETSEYRLRGLLRQDMLRSQQTLGLVDDAPTPSYDKRDPWLYSRPGSAHSYNLNTERVGLSGSFSEGSLLAEIGQQPNEQIANKNLEGSGNNFESSGRLTVRSGSASSFDQKHFLSDTDLFEREKFMNSMGDASLQLLDFSNLKNGESGKMQGLKGRSRIQPTLDIHDSGVMQAVGGGHEDVDNPFKNDLAGKAGGALGFYNHETGIDGADSEEMPNAMIYGDIAKVAENNSLLKRSYPLAMSSPAPSDLAPSQPAKGKNTTTGSSDEGKQDSAGNLTSQSLETSNSNKKDLRFRRTSSVNDADIIEPSFSDMLKSTKKPMPEPETLEAGSVGKGAKKKGKKGRQIDPSLLGFKVHSNRILMGEIQRPDD